MNEKKPRKADDAQLAIVRQLRPIDDVFFEVMMEDSDACEELLQVVLENPLLRIKKETVVGQKSIQVIGKRSIRVDAYAEGKEDEVLISRSRELIMKIMQKGYDIMHQL